MSEYQAQLIALCLVVAIAIFVLFLFAPLIAHVRWSRGRRGRGGRYIR